MLPPFRLTPRAVEDLRAIGRYTRQQWGRKQRDDYLNAIDQRFTWLAQNPHRGCLRNDVASDYYSLPQASHIIFYLVRKNGIDIIGILHQSMDIRAYFPRD
jgi:toxin ParE1/3/4